VKVVPVVNWGVTGVLMESDGVIDPDQSSSPLPELAVPSPAYVAVADPPVHAGKDCVAPKLNTFPDTLQVPELREIGMRA
jgi:hypothetical protein